VHHLHGSAKRASHYREKLETSDRNGLSEYLSVSTALDIDARDEGGWRETFEEQWDAAC
jgi:hypothetical protein